MSVNAGNRSADRGKKSTPSQKNSPRKRGFSSKTETIKGGSNSCSSAGTIDKYLIKRPAGAGVKTADNNNVSESKGKDISEKEPKEKAASSGTEVTIEKAPTPEQDLQAELIVVDDSISDADVPSRADYGSKHEELRASEPESNNIPVSEQKSSSKVSNGEQNVELQEIEEQTHSKSDPKTQGNVYDGDVTDDTQEYDTGLAENAHEFVDYKEEDFNTDSDFEKSDLETESKASEDIKEENEGQSTGPSGSKKKNTGMGILFSRRRKENCQSSSSEEETDRPWLLEKYRSRKQRHKPYDQMQAPRVARMKRQWSDWDTRQYRAGYPDKVDNPRLNMNLEFYKGRIRSKPEGAFIDEFHKRWWNDHDRLESHHGYIQWLFPIRESGMNFQAQELQPHEAAAIRKDQIAMDRFVRSYTMMLYFYGIKLVDEVTGKVARADNWQKRFQHLNHSTHNYLRITRILKSLGEMGLEYYKFPFLKFMLYEATQTRKLDRTFESCCTFWIGTVKSDDEREKLLEFANEWSRGRSTR